MSYNNLKVLPGVSPSQVTVCVSPADADSLEQLTK